MRRLYKTLAVLACAIPTISGCALGEYESRMDVQRKRLEVIDDENATITSSPIDMPVIPPAKKGGTAVPAWPFEVFLRLPREMATMAMAKSYQPPAGDLYLSRFPSTNPNFNFFVAAAKVVDVPPKDGKGRAGEFTPGAFLDRVRGALMDFYRTEYKVNPVEFPPFDLGAKAKNGELMFRKFAKYPKTDYGESLPPVEYEAIAFRDDRSRPKDPSILQFYYHRQDTKQVAIVVQFPSAWAADPNVAKALDMSLSTLDISPVGIALRRNALLSRRR